MNFLYHIKSSLKKRQFNGFTCSLFCFFFVFVAIQVTAQDSIVAKKDLTEEASLKFQEYFFKALSEKAIKNHQKAIENLENCNQIIENKPVVYFEFSKNYLALNNLILAKEYINRALEQKPNDFWMLKHLVQVYEKSSNFRAAIQVQKKISENSAIEKENLIRLYFFNRQNKKAFSLMDELEKEGGLSRQLKQFKNKVQRENIFFKPAETPQDLAALINQFEKEKTYQVLEKILEKSAANDSLLNKFSSEGLALFPAQPFVYLTKARVLFNQKKYKEALLTLQSGIDFVFDATMQASFYEQMAKNYKALGNKKEEEKFAQKAQKLRS